MLRQEYFATRLFGLVSARHGGERVAVDRLVRELTDVAHSPVETRLRTLFDVYDENGNITLRSGTGDMERTTIFFITVTQLVDGFV